MDDQSSHGVQLSPKGFADYREKTTQALTAMIKQAIEQGEVDPSVDAELAIMVMDTWSNAISSYI